MKKIVPVMICIVAIAGLLGSCSKGGPSKNRVLRVGMELAYPPFETIDEQGHPAGVSVDLARALAAAMGRELVIENTAFDGLIPALKTGRIDVILSSMTATTERAQSIDFSEPYVKTGLCLLLKKGSAIRSIADADRPGLSIAVKKGTTGNSYASARVKLARILVLDDEAACVLEVIQGKADAFIYDQMSIYKHWKRNPDTTQPLLQPFHEESWAIGVRKGDKATLREVNDFLKHYRAKGGFDVLADRWLSEQKKAFRELRFPFFFET